MSLCVCVGGCCFCFALKNIILRRGLGFTRLPKGSGLKQWRSMFSGIWPVSPDSQLLFCFLFRRVPLPARGEPRCGLRKVQHQSCHWLLFFVLDSSHENSLAVLIYDFHVSKGETFFSICVSRVRYCPHKLPMKGVASGQWEAGCYGSKTPRAGTTEPWSAGDTYRG